MSDYSSIEAALDAIDANPALRNELEAANTVEDQRAALAKHGVSIQQAHAEAADKLCDRLHRLRLTNKTTWG